MVVAKIAKTQIGQSSKETTFLKAVKKSQYVSVGADSMEVAQFLVSHYFWTQQLLPSQLLFPQSIKDQQQRFYPELEYHTVTAAMVHQRTLRLDFDKTTCAVYVVGSELIVNVNR